MMGWECLLRSVNSFEMQSKIREEIRRKEACNRYLHRIGHYKDVWPPEDPVMLLMPRMLYMQ